MTTTNGQFVKDSVEQILSALAEGTWTQEDLVKYLLKVQYTPLEMLQLVAEGAITQQQAGDIMAEWLKASYKAGKASVKKSATRKKGELSSALARKGGVSVYGLQRFPFTLYPKGWAKLAEYLGATEDQFAKSAVGMVIADKESTVESDLDSFTSEPDKKWIADVRAGKYPHATIDDATDTVTVRIAVDDDDDDNE